MFECVDVDADAVIVVVVVIVVISVIVVNVFNSEEQTVTNVISLIVMHVSFVNVHETLE